jgi:zinc transporter ZupT
VTIVIIRLSTATATLFYLYMAFMVLMRALDRTVNSSYRSYLGWVLLTTGGLFVVAVAIAVYERRRENALVPVFLAAAAGSLILVVVAGSEII